MTEQRREELAVVIRRIQKLMALGTSPNENEAALAVAKAQEMLAKYDLTMESIEDLKADKRTAIQKGDNVVKTTEGKPENWKEELFEVVAATSDCFTIYTYEYENVKTKRGYRTVKHGKLIGFGHDVEAAAYELAFLTGEVARLAQNYADAMWAEIRGIERANGITHQAAEAYYVRQTGRHPLKAKLHFLKGATSAVTSKLWQMKREREDSARAANPHAIMLRKREAVLDHIYIERYGMTKAEYDAKWALEVASRPAAPAKVETEAERKKREAQEKRWQESWNRKNRKEWANRDHAAYSAGYEQGIEITTRKGIKDGGQPGGELN